MYNFLRNRKNRELFIGQHLPKEIADIFVSKKEKKNRKEGEQKRP